MFLSSIIAKGQMNLGSLIFPNPIPLKLLTILCIISGPHNPSLASVLELLIKANLRRKLLR